MENDNTMNDPKKIKHLGKCCPKHGTILVLYDGSPLENYSVVLCSKHASVAPFNENILKVTNLVKTK